MHLFRDAQGPYLAHFHAAHEGDHTELFWETRNTPPLNWRVLRSDVEFAATAEALPGGRQVIVMQGADTHLSDRDVGDSDHSYYTVFAENADGAWQRQAEVRIAPREHFFWHHPSAERQHDADSDLHAGIQSGELVHQGGMLGLRGDPGSDQWLST